MMLMKSLDQLVIELQTLADEGCEADEDYCGKCSACIAASELIEIHELIKRAAELAGLNIERDWS